MIRAVQVRRALALVRCRGRVRPGGRRGREKVSAAQRYDGHNIAITVTTFGGVSVHSTR